MDLIPKQQKVASDPSLKSRGISIYGEFSKYDFLKQRWLILSLVAVAVSLAIFAGLKIYESKLSKKVTDLDNQIQAVKAGEDPALVEKVNKIGRINQILTELSRKHVFASQFFEELEKVTLSEVRWSGYGLNTKEDSANLSGLAASYSALANQIENFRKANFQVTVSGVVQTKDGVNFSVIIKFDTKILKQ